MLTKRAILTSMLIVSLGAGVTSCSAISESLSAQSQPAEVTPNAEVKNSFEAFADTVRSENNAVIKEMYKKTEGTYPSASRTGIGTTPPKLTAQYPESFAFLDTAVLGEEKSNDLMLQFISVLSLDPNTKIDLSEADVTVTGDTATFAIAKTVTGNDSAASMQVPGELTMTRVDTKWEITGYNAK